jgi:hypothetical protein
MAAEEEVGEEGDDEESSLRLLRLGGSSDKDWSDDDDTTATSGFSTVSSESSKGNDDGVEDGGCGEQRIIVWSEVNGGGYWAGVGLFDVDKKSEQKWAIWGFCEETRHQHTRARLLILR